MSTAERRRPANAKTLKQHRAFKPFRWDRHQRLVDNQMSIHDFCRNLNRWEEDEAHLAAQCFELAKQVGYVEAAKQLGFSQSFVFKRVKKLGMLDQVARSRGRMSAEAVEQAANTLGVCVATVQNMRRDGRLPMAFTDEDVERLRAERLIPKPPKPRKHRRGNADALYSRPAWRRARAECLLRDGNKCVRCGAQTKLVAHHIIEAHLCPNPFDVDNLETLCRRCHGLEHAHRRAIAA